MDDQVHETERAGNARRTRSLVIAALAAALTLVLGATRPVGAATVSSLMMGFAWGMGAVMVPIVGWMADRVGRPSALLAIARKALARKTGARGLRSIMEQSLTDTMYDLPTLDGVAKVVIDEHIIEDGSKPLLVYREPVKTKASA